MGLLIVEMVAATGGSLYDLVEDLLQQVGPVHYQRNDLRLNRPVAKERMVDHLKSNIPASIAGERVVEVSPLDGVKYILADDSWLLIRPSGTEPVLRVYAEGRSVEMVRAMIGYGEQVAASVT
jgi:phosphomannomutase